MTCRRFKKDMLLDMYGELEDKKRRRLEGHLADCDSCRREFETTRNVLASLDSPRPDAYPEPDWERSWSRIEAGADFGARRARPRPRPRSRRAAAWGFPRWAYAPLALAFLFVLGVVVGRYVLPTRTAVPASALRAERLSPAARRTLLAGYFEDVTPVLLDYANDGRNLAGEEALRADRKTAASLLVENMLLRRALSRKDPALADLFDDLDFILTEMSHLQSRDSSTSASLKDAIKDRRILDRIRRQEKI